MDPKQAATPPLAARGQSDPGAEGAEIEARLLATFTSPSYRPPVLPKVAVELMALSARVNVEVEEVVALLGKDSVIAGLVLQRCHSAMYAGRAEVRTLKHAVIRLGLGYVRDIVYETSLYSRVFRTSGYTEALDRVRMHSVAAGYLCRVVARHAAFDSDYAFLCGLLHDVGFTAGMLVVAEESKPPPSLESRWLVLDRIHERVAGLIAQHWKLPPEVALVIEGHHQLNIEGAPHPMRAILCIAEHLAAELSYTLAEPESVGMKLHVDENPATMLLEAMAALGLSEAQVDLIRSDARKMSADLKKG